MLTGVRVSWVVVLEAANLGEASLQLNSSCAPPAWLQEEAGSRFALPVLKLP